jgi:hypothetical protein
LAHIPDSVRNLVRAAAVRLSREAKCLLTLSPLLGLSGGNLAYLPPTPGSLAVTLYSHLHRLSAAWHGYAPRPNEEAPTFGLGEQQETPESIGIRPSRSSTRQRFLFGKERRRAVGFVHPPNLHFEPFRHRTRNQSSRSQTDFINSRHRHPLIQSSRRLGFSNLRGSGRAQFSAPPPR